MVDSYNRQIGKMLNAREPKIVNGPQILDKYVGESEANVRKLFADAEEEEKRVGGCYALGQTRTWHRIHKVSQAEIML